jgi:hypothetical protein
MSQDAKIRSVTVYLPGGAEVEIPGERAVCGYLPGGLAYVEEMLTDGGKRRFLGLPHSIVLDPPGAIKVVGVLPGRSS